MGNTPLILAALAQAALPSLNVVRVGELGGSAEERIVVATTAEGGQYEIRMPRTRATLNQLQLELRALTALKADVRERLGFQVQALTVQTAHPKGAAVFVLDYLAGQSPDLDRMNPAGTLAENLGETLGAIHNLPLSVVVDAHLPEYNPADLVLKFVNDLDRMAETGKVPAALLDRWQTALEDVSLFRYQPTVVHGSLDVDSVLTGVVDHAEVVTGILSWSQLHIGDPAEDFAWIFGSGRADLIDAVLLAYNTSHPNQDETIRQRAALYSELAFGRYLLNGVDNKDEDVIEDAVAILADLNEQLSEYALPQLTKVEAPIAPIFEASELQLDALGATQDQELDSLEYVTVGSSEDIVITSVEESSLAHTEPVDLIDDEPQAAAEVSDVTEPVEVVEPKSAEPVDDKTRPIELPEKTDNELF